MAIYVNDGLDYLNQLCLGLTGFGSMTVRLFVNNIQPGYGIQAGDFVECSLPGYAAAALTPSAWSGSTVNGVANYNYPSILWNFAAYATSAVTIYGYYVTNQATGRVIWAEAFAAPYPVPAAGGSLSLVLSWYDQNG